jgi:hypothetical protein
MSMQEQVLAFLRGAFAGSRVTWELVDLAKGNTGTASSFLDWGLPAGSGDRCEPALMMKQ